MFWLGRRRKSSVDADDGIVESPVRGGVWGLTRFGRGVIFDPGEEFLLRRSDGDVFNFIADVDGHVRSFPLIEKSDELGLKIKADDDIGLVLVGSDVNDDISVTEG